MLISLHLPKTAGMSFGKSLQEHFGNALLLDYKDAPIAATEYTRAKEALMASVKIADRGLAGYECIHGHFLPIKYLLLNLKIDITFVTWMRDPIERMLSHYHYWLRSYDPKTSASHHKKFIEENWSLERFCLGPEFRNIYSQYLWGFPLRKFDFVGIAEFYQDDFDFFSKKYLGKKGTVYEENVARNVGGRYKIEDSLREKIILHHKEDMELYKEALETRKKRN
jgi:hypothetical protein